MGKRQSMQKFIATGFIPPATLAAGAGQVALEIPIPEEILVKRVVANVLPSDGKLFSAHVIQTDSNGSAAAGDVVNVNRLVRTHYATGTEAANLDFTITMRKFAGTSVALIVYNNDAAAGGFQYKLTLHYLEV